MNTRAAPGLQLQQKQDVAMTAELRQAIELLQLNAAEIMDMVERELGENPCLEREEHDVRDERGAYEDERAEGEWSAGESLDVRDEGYVGVEYSSSGGEVSWEDRACAAPTLMEHVLRQFQQVVGARDAALRVAGRYWIEAMDADGYVRLDVRDAARAAGVSEDVMDDARAIVQTLDPVGVGARDLGECLRLQLHARGQLEAVTEMCVARLDLVALGRHEELAKLVGDGCDADEVALAVAEVKKCSPKPGLAFGAVRVEAVVPEVLVSRGPGGVGWKVELNGAAFPKLMAVPLMGSGGRSAGKSAAAKAAEHYAKERYGKAKWLVNALEQRARTTLNVAREIVTAQRQFLDAGKEFMLPLTLKDVAAKAGVHESTVSRVVSGATMLTPWGMVAFKAFFASGVASTGGNVGVASTSVQALIAKMVKGEDPKKPLSDEQLVTKLRDEGVEVARRTVAKYRGILNIPGTAERRVR